MSAETPDQQPARAETDLMADEVATPPTVVNYELSGDGDRILLEVRCGAISAVVEADRRLPDEAIEATFSELPDSIATVDEILRRADR
jgi:hypothetical protein